MSFLSFSNGRMRTLIYLIVLIIVGVVLFVCIPFGFVPLFILLSLFLFFPILEKRFSADMGEEYYSGNIPIRMRGVTYMLLVIVFGCLSLYAFKNYIYPSKSVFSNADYHTLRVDGISLGDGRGYVLAGNTNEAFFDNPLFNGRITIEETDTVEGKVFLRCSGFSEPIYKTSNGNRKALKLVNPTAYASFRDSDVVEFVKQTAQGPQVISLQIVPGSLNYSELMFWKHDRDTAQYIIDGRMPSLENRFLRSGLPLSSLMSGVGTSFNPDGIVIFRDTVSVDIRSRDVDKVYQNRPYYIGYSSDADFSEIRVNGQSVPRIRDFRAEIHIGEPFYIGFGPCKTEMVCFGWNKGELTLEFDHPKYRYLTSFNSGEKRSFGDQTVMVTTSLFEKNSELLGAYTENIALFDQFSHPDNSNQMIPWYLSYTPGTSGTPLQFSVYSDHTYLNGLSMDEYVRQNGASWETANSHDFQKNAIRYNSYLKGIRASGNGCRWLVGVENYQNTTPFPARKLALFLLIVILWSAFLIRISTINSRSLLTGAEYATYLIVIALLTIRCFLLWRVTVFPPVTSISFYEFHKFRDPNILIWLRRCVFAFYGIISLYKLYLLSFDWRWRTEGGKRGRLLSREWFFILFTVFVYGVLFLVGETVHSDKLVRMMNIMLPVLVFFAFEYLIFKYYGRTYLRDLYASSIGRNPVGDRLWPVVLSFINIGCASAYTFIRDGGYGVMFILFGLVVSIFLISDLRFYTNDSRDSKQVKIAWFLLYVFVFFFGLFYKKFFIWLLDYKLAFFIGFCFFAVVVFVLLSIVLEFKDDLKWYQWLIWIGSILAVSILILCFADHMMRGGTHLEYRTRVHMAPPSEILAKNVDNNQSQRKFMQASLNDWILDEYMQIGKDVHPLSKDGFFRLQPQSKLGAMWFAQTTDIVLSRFIIAEHSNLLAFLLVLALFIFFVVSIRGICNHRSSRFIQISVPLLLFLQAGLILFANTRHFIFFGQDFPLISVTSLLSSLYFFMLLTLFMISVLREKDATDGVIEQQQRKRISLKDHRTLVKLFVVSIGIIIVPAITSWTSKRPEDSLSQSTGGRYSLEPLMASVNEVTDSLNVIFVEYQKTHPMVLKTDMSAEMAAFRDSPDSSYQKFIKSEMLDNNKFAARIIDRFVNVGANHNSAQGLVHLRTERSYDVSGGHRDHLLFAINDTFYEYQLPRRQKDSWRGSIIGESVQQDDIDFKTQDGVTARRLKKEWIRSDEDMLLLTTNSSSPVRVLGESSIVDMSSSCLPAVAMSSRDNVMRGGREISLDMLPRKNYFARNVLVNGARTFLFPKGTEMYWLRDFAGQIKYAMETTPQKGKKQIRRKADFNKDLPITINKDLSSDIYQIYTETENTGYDRTVVVADGNGFVRAMVDFRGEPKYRLNPNDEKAIGQIFEDLYLKGLRRSPEEQRYFATFATSPLRLGPGSSQKPIVWSAVTSGYNTHFWKDLTILPLPTTKEFTDESYFYFPSFAGQRIQKTFKSIAGDEGYAGHSISLDWYMYKSSNYYNAVMAYFGLFTKDQLQASLPSNIPSDTSVVLQQGLLVRRVRPRNTSDQFRFFPIMRTENRNGYDRFSFARPITRSEYLNKNALLAYNLENNFQLSLERRTSTGLYPSVTRKSRVKGKWVERPGYREVSFFNMGIRNKYVNPAEMMEVGLRTVAIGNNTSWIVSPLKMAEMYGKLITLNKNYTLTLDPTVVPKYESFNLDDSWGNTDASAMQNYQRERQQFIYGLSSVFGSTGTAGSLFSETLKSKGIVLDNSPQQIGRYYIYGKTGTINAKWDGKPCQDHMLAVVITDTKISSASDLSSVKFYVLYFADYHYISWKDVDRKIIEKVIESDVFKSYMGA